MTILIQDSTKPVPNHTPKVVILDGKEAGEIKPTIHGEKLMWHANITVRFDERCGCNNYYLAQGWGETPEQALAASVKNAQDYVRLLVPAVEKFAASNGIKSPTRTDGDAKRLNWLECHSVEIGFTDDEPQLRGVWLITGGRNDREWSLRGSGDSVRAAIDKARGASEGDQPNEELAVKLRAELLKGDGKPKGRSNRWSDA